MSTDPTRWQCDVPGDYSFVVHTTLATRQTFSRGTSHSGAKPAAVCRHLGQAASPAAYAFAATSSQARRNGSSTVVLGVVAAQNVPEPVP